MTIENWISLELELEIGIVNLHLDDKREKTRIIQMKEVFDWIERIGVPENHILCGDFNALDGYYSSDGTVSKEREAMKLEKPSCALYHSLIERGYIDLEESKPARITCQYNTRVDYMFASKKLFQRIDEKRLEVVPSGSDHKELKLTLRFTVK